MTAGARLAAGLLGGAVALAAAYVALLCRPQAFFPYGVTAGNLTLYCDDPVGTAAGAAVLADAEARLERCPLYRDRPTRDVFICDNVWLRRLFFPRKQRAGGVAYGFPPWNVFLSRSDIAHNILFRGDGRTPSGKDRPLSYFVAHEITHTLVARDLGPWAYWRIPVWVNEGYADYIGKAGNFDFQKNLALFRAGDPSLDPHASGLYLRYQLLVEDLLERRGLSVEGLLRGNFDRAGLEAGLRAGPPNQKQFLAPLSGHP